MNKRGLSLVITTLILIVLVLVAIAIIWVVVSNILKGGTEGVALGTFTVEVDVKGVSINESANTISILVKRNPGRGDVSGFKFVFKNETETEIHTKNIAMTELEERLFTFTLTMHVSEVVEISIIPLIKSGDKELFGLETVYNVQASSGGGIPPGGNGGLPDEYFIALYESDSDFAAGTFTDTTYAYDSVRINKPVPVGEYVTSFPYYASNVYALFALDDFAYIMSFGQGHLTIFNVSNKSNPIPVGSYNDTEPPYSVRHAQQVFVLDDFAYVPSWSDNSLTILDVSNKSNLTPV